MTHVLLAEDDPAISEPLARALRREGYAVDVREDGPSALAGGHEGPDLLILDLGLPGMDGLEVCRRLRAEGSTVPVLILTARADEVDAVVIHGDDIDSLQGWQWDQSACCASRRRCRRC